MKLVTSLGVVTRDNIMVTKPVSIHSLPRLVVDGLGGRRWLVLRRDSGHKARSSNNDTETTITLVATDHHMAHHKGTPYDPLKAKLQKLGTPSISCFYSHLNHWIIDSGAFEHMSGNLSLFIDLKDCQDQWVQIPSGKSQRVLQTSSMRLSPFFTL